MKKFKYPIGEVVARGIIGSVMLGLFAVYAAWLHNSMWPVEPPIVRFYSSPAPMVIGAPGATFCYASTHGECLPVYGVKYELSGGILWDFEGPGQEPSK